MQTSLNSSNSTGPWKSPLPDHSLGTYRIPGHVSTNRTSPAPALCSSPTLRLPLNDPPLVPAGGARSFDPDATQLYEHKASHSTLVPCPCLLCPSCLSQGRPRYPCSRGQKTDLLVKLADCNAIGDQEAVPLSYRIDISITDSTPSVSSILTR